MRILFLTQRLPYAPNRGDRIRAYYMLREMSRFASVSLFSLIHDDEEASHVERTPFADRVVGVRVTRARNLLRGAARLASKWPLTHSLLDAPDARTRLSDLVAAAPPDLVVAYCSSMARFAMEPPLETLPFVLDMVDVDSAKWRQLAAATRGPRRWIYNREAELLSVFEASAARRAQATLVVNEREREALLRIAPQTRVSVVPIGIDVEAYAPRTGPATAPVVIFCGVMNYYPNEEGVRWFAEHVWPRVRSGRSDARFVVVGSNPTRQILDLTAKDQSIDIVGQVPEVQPHLWGAAVSVAPLRLSRGVQNKVLEALAAGLPVVVAPSVWSGLPPEARAGCVSAERPDEFADAVLGLLDSSPENRGRRASAAHVERLSWTTQLATLKGILQGAS